MADFGIICELNPLHNGHRHLFDQARSMGADRIVCIMSGNTVQRGEIAIADKYIRAESAVRCGADLVLELPFPWCSGSAESFSEGGIEILRHFADTLLFGSECGRIDVLAGAAEASASEPFRTEYKKALSDGAPAAAAYYDILNKYCGQAFSSNDLLGVEYLRACKRIGVELKYLTVPRQGDAYDSAYVLDPRYPSALAIRALWKEGQYTDTEKYLPRESFRIYEQAAKDGSLTSAARLEEVLLSFFRLHEGADFEGILGTEGGLANRFCLAAGEACDGKELMDRIRTKRYTDAHLRRVMLYCVTGVMASDMERAPLYTTVLAASPKGRTLLSEKRKDSSFLTVTKPADVPRDSRQYHLTRKADSLFSLICTQRRPASYMLTQTPYIQQ